MCFTLRLFSPKFLDIVSRPFFSFTMDGSYFFRVGTESPAVFTKVFQIAIIFQGRVFFSAGTAVYAEVNTVH